LQKTISLRNKWKTIVAVAKKRLKNNSKTEWHRSEFGDELEIMGAAGEIAARLFLKLPLRLSTKFDNGVDLEWQGYSVDVKATRWVSTIMSRYLQWPEKKNIKADFILLTAIDFNERRAKILGYCTGEELRNAPVNEKREIPCMEIPIKELKDPEDLFSLTQKRKEKRAEK